MFWGKFTVPVLASILILGAFTVGYSIDDAFAKGNGQPKVTICHVDQDTGEKETISVSNKAVDKHKEKHGDELGECVDEPEPVCGNNVTEAPEECDDGNTVTESCNYSETSCTVCASDCSEQAGATSFCGDSNTDSANGETCDDGASNGTPGSCNVTCNGIAPAVCGDGIVTAPETCDDGNTDPRDGCKQCQAATGSGSFVLSICSCANGVFFNPNVCLGVLNTGCLTAETQPICEPLCQEIGSSFTGAGCGFSSFCTAD